MKILSLLTMISLIALNAMAQNISWQKSFTYENLTQGHSLSINDSSCYILSEVSNGIYGLSDLVVTKQTQLGQVVWNKILGSPFEESGKNAVIKCLSDGSVVIIGFSKVNSFSDRDVFCSKLSGDGDIIWSKTMPFLNGNEVPRDVIELVNGDLIMVGSIVSQSFGSNDGFISRIDSAGNVVWSRNIGGSQNEHFYGVQEMSNCILVAGNCQSIDNIHHPWLVKISHDGVILNEKVYAYQSTELFMSIALNDNQIYTTGYTTDSIGVRHMWVGSFSSDLELEWCTTAIATSEGVDIKISNDTIIVVGNKTEETVTRVLISQFDLEGNSLLSLSSPNSSSNFVSSVTGVAQVIDSYLVILNTNIYDSQTSVLLSSWQVGSPVSCSYEEITMPFEFCELLEMEVFSNIQSLGNMINYPIECELYELGSDSLSCFLECEVELTFSDTICENEYFGISYIDFIGSNYAWYYNGDYISNQDSILIENLEDNQLEINLVVNSQIETCSIDTVLYVNIIPSPSNLLVDTTLCSNSNIITLVNQVIGDDFFWDLENEYFPEGPDSNYVFIGNHFNSCGSADFAINLFLLDENSVISLPEYSCDTVSFSVPENCSWSSGTDLSLENVILPHTYFNDTLIYSNGSCYFEIPLIVHSPELMSNPLIIEKQPCKDSIEFFISEFEHQVDQNYLYHSSLDDGTFEITYLVENACGSELVSYTLFAEECNCSINNFFIPNAFSPNRDNVNDVFDIITNCEFLSFQLSIFNRFGECIFQTQDPQQPWTGNVHNGEHYAPDGIYTWQLISSTAQHPPTVQTGHVTLLR